MKKFLNEFKAFALRGNVIDLAVGVIIGGAFQAIVKSLVDDLIMPFVGLATGGGVTFGGGEPALHSDFIVAFKELCGDEWNITLETSLNVPTEHILKLIPVVDDYIIDIKSLKESIYQSYTGLPLEPVIDNLQLLVAHGKASHITVRTPRIPRYNTIFDVRRSISMLRDMGIERIDSFTYITNRKKI